MAKAQEMGYGFVDLDRVIEPAEARSMISSDMAWTHRILPLRFDQKTSTLWFAVDHPKSSATMQIIKEAVNCRIVPVLAMAEPLTVALRKAYPDQPKTVHS